MAEENGEAEGEPSAKKSKSSSGQLNQFIVGLVGVLEQDVTEKERTDKYRPQKKNGFNFSGFSLPFALKDI